MGLYFKVPVSQLDLNSVPNNTVQIICIVSPCIFVHLVFHQIMHSYILLKYYHRQLLLLHVSLLHVSIRTDHHQGVLLVLAKLLIKIIKL